VIASSQSRGRVAVLKTVLATEAYPLHGEVHALRQEPDRDVMAAHQATQGRATEVQPRDSSGYGRSPMLGSRENQRVPTFALPGKT